MKKQIEHWLLLIVVVIVQPLLAIALMTMWNGQHLAMFLDYYHALALVMIGSIMILLTTLLIVVYNWLYVDEIFDYKRRDEKKNGTDRNNLP